MNISKKFLGFTVASLLSCSSLLFAKEVKIGVIMPMSGPIGGFGQSAVEGLNLMHKLNPKLANGDDIKLVLIDNKSDTIESANAASKLI